MLSLTLFLQSEHLGKAYGSSYRGSLQEVHSIWALWEVFLVVAPMPWNKLAKPPPPHFSLHFTNLLRTSYSRVILALDNWGDYCFFTVLFELMLLCLLYFCFASVEWCNSYLKAILWITKQNKNKHLQNSSCMILSYLPPPTHCQIYSGIHSLSQQ